MPEKVKWKNWDYTQKTWVTITENNQILKGIDLIAAQAEQEILEKEEWQPITEEWKDIKEEKQSFSENSSNNNNQPKPYHYQNKIYQGKN